MNTFRKGCLTSFKKGMLWGFLILGLILSTLVIINYQKPNRSVHLDNLSFTELDRLQEIDHLRASVGELIWPGFSDQVIPVILYNEAYVFLSGINNPEAGWKTVPFDKPMGGAWTYINSTPPHFRQPIISSEQIPEAFTVKVGDTYAASMTTKEWTEIQLTQMIKNDLPPFFKPVFPYFLITDKLDSDWHISAIMHESFHAFQAEQAPERVYSAEASNTFERSYPWKDPDLRETWLNERLLLGRILKTTEDQIFRKLTKEWLVLRESRRNSFSTSKFTDYEREREWLEGLAKYAEIQSLMLASNSDIYEPLSAMKDDGDFSYYKNGSKNHNREIKQLQSDFRFSDTIFYYTGWAQSEILDRLVPGWKSQAFEPGVYLDDMIRLALEPEPFVETLN
ncbi:hypothetical protein [Gracilimonas amylolytica]|uniref:hypothetical protein n=1 Tax=Gracilimonas amylolytica TaxID=1749045 RepID=UPI0012FFE4D4|nr:hypothetical protein [Gracilimonas amylolytica]